MKLKKISVLALSLFLCFGSSVSAFGENTKILTISEAVEKALKYSKNLKSYEEENKVNDINILNTRQTLLSSGESEQIANLAVQLKELYAKSEKNKLSAEDEKENIEYSILSFFIDIINAENKVKLFEEEVSLKEKQLKISEAKVKYGRISDNDYKNEQLEYKNLLKQKEELQNNIDNAHTSLNKVLGADLNTKHTLDLEENITYKSIFDNASNKINIESTITMAIDKNNTIKAQETAVDIAKYSLSTYTSETGSDTRASKLASYNKEVRALEDEKTSLRESITKNYNETEKNENEYKANIAELENMKKQLEIKELNFKLGKSTEIEIEEYKYEIKKLENTIQEQIYNQELLVRKLKNPALL